MKRLLFALMFLMAGAISLSAQNRPSQRSNLNAATAVCTPSNAASSVALTIGPNDGGAVVQVAGTFSGTVSFAVTGDGTNWVSATGSPTVAGAGVTSTTAAGAWQINVAAMTGVCAFMSSFSSGLAEVFVSSSQGTPDDSTVTITGAVSASIPILCPPGYAHVQGAVITTAAGSSVLIPAPTAGLNLYIVSIESGNTGATNSLLSFSTNGNATAMLNGVNPTNTTPFGGSNVPLPGVLVTTATGKSFDVVTGSASTTQYINAQGCSGP